MAKTSNLNSLQEFSNIIQRQAEERRQFEDEAYAQLVKDKGKMRKEIRWMSNEELLDYIRLHKYSSEARTLMVFDELKEYAIKEALQRMEK